LYQIIDIAARELFTRMTSLGITIELTKGAKEFLSDKGFDPAFGARPLRRAVQKYVEDPLAEEILRGTFQNGSKVRVKLNRKKESLEFVDSSRDKGSDEIKEEGEEVVDSN